MAEGKQKFQQARNALATKKTPPVSPKKDKKRPVSSVAGSPGKGINNQNQMAAMLAALKGGA